MLALLLRDVTAMRPNHRQGHAVRDHPEDRGPDRRPQGVGPGERGEDVGQLVKVLPGAVGQGGAQVPQHARLQRNPQDLGARGGRKGVVRRKNPVQVLIDPEQDGDAIEVQGEREHEAKDGVESQERRESEKHPEGVGGGGSFRRVVGVKQLYEPAACLRRQHLARVNPVQSG